MKRRGRLGSEAWGNLIARQAASGMKVRAFCAQESVSVSGFYRWRGLLSGDDSDDEPSGLTVSPSTDADFINLGALTGGRDGRPIELRLDLGSGVRLQLVCG